MRERNCRLVALACPGLGVFPRRHWAVSAMIPCSSTMESQGSGVLRGRARGSPWSGAGIKRMATYERELVGWIWMLWMLWQRGHLNLRPRNPNCGGEQINGLCALALATASSVSAVPSAACCCLVPRGSKGLGPLRRRIRKRNLENWPLPPPVWAKRATKSFIAGWHSLPRDRQWMPNPLRTLVKVKRSSSPSTSRSHAQPLALP